MSWASRACRHVVAGEMVLMVVAGLPLHAFAQGAAGGGQLLELLARAFMTAEDERVTINMATAAELEKRLGIEGVVAKRIVAGRPYASVRDLARAGIPSEITRKIVPLVTVGPMPGWRRLMVGQADSAVAAPAAQRALARWVVFRDILFDFDKSDVRPAEADTIKGIADVLKQDLSLTVRLDGSADPRGTTPYNFELSDRRVRAVHHALAAQGVAALRVRIAATEEMSQSCAERTEECYQRNRRVGVQLRTDE